MRMPIKDEIWKHTKSDRQYIIVGAVFNTITDRVDVNYKPLINIREDDYDLYSRQIKGHPKAFISLNEDGKPRFQYVKTFDEYRAEIEKLF